MRVVAASPPKKLACGVVTCASAPTRAPEAADVCARPRPPRRSLKRISLSFTTSISQHDSEIL